MHYIFSEMINQLLLKRLINELVLSFGIRRTTWWKQKKQLDDKEVYQDLRRGVEDSFDKVTKKVKRKLRLL